MSGWTAPAWSQLSYTISWGTYGTPLGSFRYPLGISIDIDEPTEPNKPLAGLGNVYVADSRNHRVQKFGPTGAFLTAWGTQGSGPGQFQSVHGLSIFRTGPGAGFLFAADSGNARIQKFSNTGAFLLAWGSFGTGPGQFREPEGVATDSVGNVFVADRNNARVQKFNSSGVFLSQLNAAGMNQPQGVAVAASGNIYVLDTAAPGVFVFNSSGAFLFGFGSAGSGPGQFQAPKGITCTRGGTVYVADTGNHRIEAFSSTGTFQFVYGSLGTGNGQFNAPSGVSVDLLNQLYVSDTGNHRIQKFQVTYSNAIPALPRGGGMLIMVGLGVGLWWFWARRRRAALPS